MNKYGYVSGMADEMALYIDYKVRSGFKEVSFIYRMRKFDSFCAARGITDISFTEDDSRAWGEKIPDEAEPCHYARINFVKNFMIYLSRKGCSVYVPKDIKSLPSGFTPHIYTDDEISRYFDAVDTYDPKGGNRKNRIQLPVLFRILYCCGTRLNETLGIRKKDVDLKAGIIALRETKNNNTRYIVVSDELKFLLSRYADRRFYELSDNDYIFSCRNGHRLGLWLLDDFHRKFLDHAGIPYIGDHKGPRIHDFRHTFAVRAFKQLVDSGKDLYVALPVLSTYLGHKTIYATERYLRLTVSIYPYIAKKWETSINDIFGKEHADEKD